MPIAIPLHVLQDHDKQYGGVNVCGTDERITNDLAIETTKTTVRCNQSCLSNPIINRMTSLRQRTAHTHTHTHTHTWTYREAGAAAAAVHRGPGPSSRGHPGPDAVHRGRRRLSPSIHARRRRRRRRGRVQRRPVARVTRASTLLLMLLMLVMVVMVVIRRQLMLAHGVMRRRRQRSLQNSIHVFTTCMDVLTPTLPLRSTMDGRTKTPEIVSIAESPENR